MSPEETFKRIHITVGEYNSNQCRTEHLIDDYTLSRNIARFGLQFDTIQDICGRLGWKGPDGRGVSPFLWHKYSMPTDQKVHEMLGILCSPNGSPAFPVGIPGELVSAPQGPLFKSQKASVYGPAGTIVAPVGVGWGLMDADEAKSFVKRWKLGV